LWENVVCPLIFWLVWQSRMQRNKLGIKRLVKLFFVQLIKLIIERRN